MDISRHKGSAHDYAMPKLEHVQALDSQRMITGNSRHSGSGRASLVARKEDEAAANGDANSDKNEENE
jgi:hypothetical protein